MTDRQQSESDDLTGDDHLAVRTGNGLRAAEEALKQPSQDPDVIPASLVDANGTVIA